MLKQLIQLFAEKFLQNKREAIQAWNYPTNTGTQLQLVAGKDYEFVPPPLQRFYPGRLARKFSRV